MMFAIRTPPLQAYPGYAIWNGPGQGMAPSDVTGWRASFGAHAIVYVAYSHTRL